MVLDVSRLFLDIEKTISKYGRFTPIFLFAYLSSIEPKIFNFIFLGISVLLCLVPSHFSGYVTKFFNKSGSPKYEKISKLNKKKKFFAIMFIFLMWFVLIIYSLYLLITKASEMVTSGKGNIILIILLIMTLGVIVIIFFPPSKESKKEKIEERLD